MSWARLDDAILDNPKIIAAGPLGFALHVAAITWCARNLTDGFIPKRRVAQLLDLASLQVSERTKVRILHAVTADDVAADLARIGLWHDHGESWELHHFLEYNFSRAQVLHRREKALDRVNKHRHLACNAVTNAAVTRLPGPGPVPVPRETLSLTPFAQGDRSPKSHFADFWATYPRKRHKPAALRAWQVVKGDAQLAAVVAGVERWKTSAQWDEGYVEDPATFLRQRQWEDDPPAARAGRSEDTTAQQVARIRARLTKHEATHD
jgi:hypothetical protein